VLYLTHRNPGKLMKRPDCIRHWRDVEGADDSTYPDSDERFSIGAPLARKLGRAYWYPS
jgi:hypothetical protein